LFGFDHSVNRADFSDKALMPENDPRFVSTFELVRSPVAARDDLESLLFTLAFAATGTLPWITGKLKYKLSVQLDQLWPKGYDVLKELHKQVRRMNASRLSSTWYEDALRAVNAEWEKEPTNV
jgi:hypothetical protein